MRFSPEKRKYLVATLGEDKVRELEKGGSEDQFDFLASQHALIESMKSENPGFEVHYKSDEVDPSLAWVSDVMGIKG